MYCMQFARPTDRSVCDSALQSRSAEINAVWESLGVHFLNLGYIRASECYLIYCKKIVQLLIEFQLANYW